MGVGCFEDLSARGLVHDTTGEAKELQALLDGPGIAAYCGFDPTGDSLHVGNLVPLLALRRLQLAGHTPIALAGGATGLIGDPSGKSAERNMLTREVLAHNVASIKGQLARLLDFDTSANSAKLVDNADWLSPVTLLEFLRDVGKHFTVNYMISKDSVKSRLERDSGISFTEFTYMLLQAADFKHLFSHHGCMLQIGGSDQWGNITAGTELIRRTEGKSAFGLTLPLITTATGAKFGKTEQGAIWLSAKRTSPYQFYQYFVRTDDRDVGKFLRYFTFLEIAEIEALEEKVVSAPDKREAQRALARSLTALIHGDDAVRSAIAGSELLFGGSPSALSEADLLAVAEEIPRTEVNEPFGEARDVIDLLVMAKLADGRGAAKRLLAQGGVYVSNERRSESDGKVSAAQLLFGKYLLLRSGKKSYHLMNFGAGAA
jgi:tyrosyl-tRNA synthetase